MGNILQIIHIAFQVYMLMIFVRVIGTWFPNFSRHNFMRFLGYYTDPYLNFFRRFIPPIGGVLDLSPLLAFFSLQILEVAVRFILLHLFY